jgi:hypothetical protein
MKTSENVETYIHILPGTFIWPRNASSSSGSSSGIFFDSSSMLVITSFWMGVTAHWMGQQILSAARKIKNVFSVNKKYPAVSVYMYLQFREISFLSEASKNCPVLLSNYYLFS